MQRACPSVGLSVCLLPKYKNAIFSKTKQFTAMVSIDDLVVRLLFEEPIIGPLKSKMTMHCRQLMLYKECCTCRPILFKLSRK